MSRKVLISLVAMAAATPLAAQTATPAPQAGAAAGTGTAATASAPIGPVSGATVYDTTGAVVGTIESVTAQTAVVSTGTAKGALPLNSFAAGPKGPVIALNKAQLEAAMQQASASSPDKLKGQLTAGATVKGSGGNVVGTVKSADDQFVTLTTPKGDVRLPMTGFAAGIDGPVVGLTADQLDAAIGSSASATTDTAGTAATSTTTATTTKTSKTTKKRR